MALFENYDRRIGQINETLKKYGISSIEETKQICDAKGIDPYKIAKETQPICFENAGWAYVVGAAIAIKKGCTKAADAAEAIAARRAGIRPDPLALHFPNSYDGLLGVRFVESVIASSNANGAWRKC